MLKPQPYAYGLPSNYDWKASKQLINSKETLASFIGGIVGFGGGGALAVLLINVLHSFVGDYALWTIPFLFIGCIAGAGVLITRVLNPLLVPPEAERAKKYGEALEAWEYHTLETGIGFWIGQRGIAFEQALMRLFAKRGCKVEMTKTTGDGGIDLVLSVAGVTYWCQCKGQQKPVSVAPIREIAGVCSKATNKAVVFAVNGYTRPAHETARQLGVRLFDASDICSLAKQSAINRL
jgi:hypothetical protein